MALQEYEVISFDFDGTLVDPRFIDRFWNEVLPEVYAEERGLGLEEAKAVIFRAYDEVGSQDIRWYLPSYWHERFGLCTTVNQLLERSGRWLVFYPDATRALSRLKGRYKLVIASAASREFIEFALKKLDVDFHRTFSSTSDFGLIRKTADFYHAVCRDLGISPLRLVHVGDHPHFDYEIPAGLGIKAFLVDRAGVLGDGPHVLGSLEELTVALT